MMAQTSGSRDPNSRNVDVSPSQNLNNTCLVCFQGGIVLSCSNDNCPIVIHQACLCIAPQFDNNGVFYCPYCFYKMSTIEYGKAKKNALLAKQALSIFLVSKKSMEMKHPETQLPTTSGCVSKEAENLNDVNLMNNETTEDMNDKGSKRRCCRTHPMKTGAPEKSGIPKQQEKATVEEKKGEQAPKQKVSVSLSKEDGQVKKHKESKKDGDLNNAGKQDGHVRRSNRVRKQVVSLEDCDHSASSYHSCSTGTMNKGGKEFEFNELDDDDGVTSRRQTVRSTKWKERPMLPTKKRTPLRWTDEEVDMLKEGVVKFSSTINKNIPWRKILEYGCQVFHGTRQPEDLREKWKKLGKKC